MRCRNHQNGTAVAPFSGEQPTPRITLNTQYTALFILPDGGTYHTGVFDADDMNHAAERAYAFFKNSRMYQSRVMLLQIIEQ